MIYYAYLLRSKNGEIRGGAYPRKATRNSELAKCLPCGLEDCISVGIVEAESAQSAARKVIYGPWDHQMQLTLEEIEELNRRLHEWERGALFAGIDAVLADVEAWEVPK